MREKRKTLDKKDENLKLKKLAKKQKLQEQGITLIALVVTIIILLILSGVTLNISLSDTGLFSKTKEAVKKYEKSSEKEAIELIMSDIKIGLKLGEEIPQEKYVGEKLSEMTAITGDWKNVIVGENTYKDGWYLVEKGEKVTGYGETKLNWLINYNTGEIIELEDGKYTVANASASGAIVDNTLKLNIDPSNLQNKNNWGDGVSFHGENGNDKNSGVKDTEIKFDGKDDYKTEGFTFEFYGKNYGEEYSPICKTSFEGDNIDLTKYMASTFRVKRRVSTSNLGCCFGSGDSGSNLSNDDSRHWIDFNMPNDSEIEYYSITINFPTSDDTKALIKLYQNGKEICETDCDGGYLEKGDLFNNNLCFTVGLIVSEPSGTGVAEYGNFDLYACRLYTRVLTDEEIQQNYTATTEYHDNLIKKT